VSFEKKTSFHLIQFFDFIKSLKSKLGWPLRNHGRIQNGDEPTHLTPAGGAVNRLPGVAVNGVDRHAVRQQKLHHLNVAVCCGDMQLKQMVNVLAGAYYEWDSDSDHPKN